MEIDTDPLYRSGSVLKQLANRSLRAILRSQYVQRDVDELIHACKSLALPLLRVRLRNDMVLRNALELTVEDIAIDCVADLFTSAGPDEFPHLKAYFAPYPLDELTDEELLSDLRRLVFSLVNQGLFRIYNEVDPTFGRIIRNIKLALPHFDSLVQMDLFDEPCLALPERDPDDDRRMFEFEDLEAGLRNYLTGTENIPFMLGKLTLLLREREDVSKVVPLILAARAFKSLYMHHEEIEEPVRSFEGGIETEAVAKLVHETVRAVKEKKAIEYSEKVGIDPALVETYFTVIEEKLMLTFSGDGAERSLGKLLLEHMAGLSESEYAAEHRNRLQYLARVTGKEVARRLGRQ